MTSDSKSNRKRTMMKMFVIRLFYFLLFSFIIDLTILVMSVTGSWKMKVCLNGSTYETTEKQCRFGVWFTEPKKIQRVCFYNGMWALYKDWCESNPTLWTTHPGRKGCITKSHLLENILGIVYLGNNDNGAVMSTTQRRLFFNNEKQKKGDKWDFLDSEVEVLTWGTKPYSLLEIVNYHKNQKCLIKGMYAFFAHYKIELESNIKAELMMEEDSCTTKLIAGTQSQVLPIEIEFDILQSQSESMDFPCENEEKKTNCANYYKALSPKEVEEIVDEQSQRIALTLYALRFNQESLPDMELEEWRFLEIAKDIFENVCTDKLVPRFFYDNIFPLFQYLLLESFIVFPPAEDTENAARARIENSLNTCFRNSKPFEYHYDETCSSGAPLLKGNNSEGKSVLKLVEVPSIIKTNTEKFDLILEATWKLMVFTHYYCADYFKSYASDLSLLLTRWQSLIAPDLIRRWKNPGKSFEVMKRIFMSINIEKTIQNVDYCLGAAHLQSTYKGWIKRPLTKRESIRTTGQNKQNLMWNGNAYCMSEYLYPATKLKYPIEKCGIKLPY